MQSVLYPLSQPLGVPLEWKADVDGIENQVITLYPSQTREVWEGFGAALTGASGTVYAQMRPEQRREMMEMYFSPAKMGYDRVRIHMDSCDFCAEMYEADGDEADAALERFDFSRTEELILPMLRDAQAAAGRPLKIMLSPWSPPAYMKTNGERCHGGSLRPEYAERWAEYICRYIREFQARGFAVERISLQNEPKAVQTWDSCVYTDEQEKAFLPVMHAALARNGLDDIEIFLWDHNKERAFERASAILDETTRPMVAGVACHWYSGDHFENLDMIRSAYPELKLILSESCVGFLRPDDAQAHAAGAVQLSHEILGDLTHGATAFYDWNLLLDERGGPNHVGNFCHAPYKGQGTAPAASAAILLPVCALHPAGLRARDAQPVYGPLRGRGLPPAGRSARGRSAQPHGEGNACPPAPAGQRRLADAEAERARRLPDLRRERKDFHDVPRNDARGAALPAL